MQKHTQLISVISLFALHACKSSVQPSRRIGHASSSNAPAVAGQNAQGTIGSTTNAPSTPGNNVPGTTFPDTIYPDNSGTPNNTVVEDSGTKTKITFRGSQGDQVPGYIWIPKQMSGRVPAVLLMYGLNGNKDDGGVNQAAQKLNEHGIVAMTLDWPGTGERGNIPNEQRIFGQGFDQTIKDYKAALDYLATRPEVNMQKLGYVGASWGAITGAAFVAQEPRIRAMVALVPVPNPLLGQNSPDVRLAQVPPRPLLCIYSQNGGDMSDTICNAARSPTTTTTGLASDHEMSGVRDQVYEMCKNFLVKHLK